MGDGKDPIITELEQSLIHLLSTRKELDDKVPGGLRRLRALTFNVDVKNPKNPFFTIQIGICEASFNITTGLKEKGSCFGIERYIRDWYERPSVKNAVQKIVEDAKHKS